MSQTQKKIEYIINENNCHICISHVNGRYPRARINGKRITLNRYFWEKEYGPIPEGMFVCHNCDNTQCINPEHFFLGTALDNAHDRDNKGRHRYISLKGNKNNSKKLTKEMVLQIRQEEGYQKDIAKKYDISQSMVEKIKNKKVWAWLE